MTATIYRLCVDGDMENSYHGSDTGKHVLWSLQVYVCQGDDGLLDAQLSRMLFMEQRRFQVCSVVWARQYKPTHLMVLGQVMMHLQPVLFQLTTTVTERAK